MAEIPAEVFTPEDRQVLAPYFTNLDGPVFALVNLPEVVKGALFARYSRSAKSLRRLFLDEFLDNVEPVSAPGAVGVKRAEELYERVFNEYGDDSVAQLGGVHLACEGASNILTKVLEWGRLMAYLEQSTRYVPYTDRPGGRWKYHVPAELEGSPLRARYLEVLHRAFETYARWIEPMRAHYSARYPKVPGESDSVYRLTIRAKALDTLRGLLPAATQSNVGIYGTGQAYEALLLRMRTHPLSEVRTYADLMLAELRKVIPAFLKRVDRPDRGGAWSRYFAETSQATQAVAEKLLSGVEPEPRPEVMLTDCDPEGEVKVVAAALYAVSDLPDDQLLTLARRMSHEERATVLRAYVGSRANRRHKPGRAFERSVYRFDILTDYGAFRDLQRHRLLTLEWQPLSPRHGYTTPEAIEEARALDDWRQVMEESAELYDELRAEGLELIAPYAVAMAYRIRFYMELNAREAMHIIELRTAPQGHPAYRRVCQAMHRLIAEQAGHRAVAEAMTYADHSPVELERLEAERAAERRRQTARESTIYAAVLYGVNIPGGVSLTSEEVEAKLRALSRDVKFIRCVGDADNVLLQSSIHTQEDDIAQLLQRTLGIKGAVVIALTTLRQILDAARRELQAQRFSSDPPFKISWRGDEWEFGLVISSEILPSGVQGNVGLFAPKKNVVALRLLHARALLVQKRCSTASGRSRIMFGNTVIGPWKTVLKRHGVSVQCLTSRALGRIAEIVQAAGDVGD